MQTEDAYRLRDVLAEHEVEYMIIGKGAAVLMGYSGTTQDIDIYPSKDSRNRERLLGALVDLGFQFDVLIEGIVHFPAREILDGKDFIQLKGPFDLDVVFAPDGFESYEEAIRFKTHVDGFPVLGIDGIIKTKEAAGRKKDLNDIDDLKLFAAWLKKRGNQGATD